MKLFILEPLVALQLIICQIKKMHSTKVFKKHVKKFLGQYVKWSSEVDASKLGVTLKNHVF